MISLSIEAITATLTLQARSFIPSILILDTVSSTNEYLLQLNKNTSHNGWICLARTQTNGRGRNGKPWVSPECGNIYFSLCWEPTHIPPTLSALSLLVGLSCIRACEQVGITQLIQIKWPNDLLIHNKKCGGILIETKPLIPSHRIVIGIGINLYSHCDMQPNWTSIQHESGQSIDPNVFVSELIQQLSQHLPVFEKHGFAPFQSFWNAHNALDHRLIRVMNQVGTAQGVNEKGELLMITDQGEKLFLRCGEISIEC